MLDSFSQDVADALFVKFPEWRGLATTRQDADGGEHLHLSVARPVENDPVGGLTISTKSEEATVQCGRHWHSHFDTTSELLDFIAEVLDERQVFARFQQGDSVLGGRSVEPAAAKLLIATGPPSEPFHPRIKVVADTVSLWSWRGNYDATVKRGRAP
jgi:hypothetical protein